MSIFVLRIKKVLSLVIALPRGRSLRGLFAVLPVMGYHAQFEHDFFYGVMMPFVL